MWSPMSIDLSQSKLYIIANLSLIRLHTIYKIIIMTNTVLSIILISPIIISYFLIRLLSHNFNSQTLISYPILLIPCFIHVKFKARSIKFLIISLLSLGWPILLFKSKIGNFRVLRVIIVRILIKDSVWILREILIIFILFLINYN